MMKLIPRFLRQLLFVEIVEEIESVDAANLDELKDRLITAIARLLKL